jgi:hypothetical protein
MHLTIILHVLRSAIANQESLSGLETEMRKLEGIVKEISEELNYLKGREERFSSTNGANLASLCFTTLTLALAAQSPR